MKIADQIADTIYKLDNLESRVDRLCRAAKRDYDGLLERERQSDDGKALQLQLDYLQHAYEAIQSATGHLEEALTFQEEFDQKAVEREQ